MKRRYWYRYVWKDAEPWNGKSVWIPLYNWHNIADFMQMIKADPWAKTIEWKNYPTSWKMWELAQ